MCSFELFPRRRTGKWSPQFPTRFYSCFKNFMDNLPGWTFLTWLAGHTCRHTFDEPPFQLPEETLQSFLSLIRIALSPPCSFRVQHFSCSASLAHGLESTRMRCALVATFPVSLITSTDDNCDWAECNTRQAREPLSLAAVEQPMHRRFARFGWRSAHRSR